MMTDYPFRNFLKRCAVITGDVSVRRVLSVCILLILLTLAVFWQVRDHEFITLDDNVYVTENPRVQRGLTLENVKWAVTTGEEPYWHPVTWLSHMLDVQLFGLKAGHHHLVNVLLHILNTLLLFLIFRHLTKAFWPSAFVAALFALHPLHVESVAWATERKDVLSTLFWMLTMGAYGYYAEHPSYRRYLLVLVFFLLGLMSKPMLVTMPFVLLLLDYWPLGRFRQARQKEKRPSETDRLHPKAPSGRSQKRTKVLAREIPARISQEHDFQWSVIPLLLIEKVPLLVFSIFSSIITYFNQQNAMSSLLVLPLSSRIANALVSYVKYIAKMVWPQDLAVFYPHLDVQPWWQLWGAIAILSFATFGVIRTSKRFPYLFVGWLWYLGTLIPVIGFVQVGLQAMADRFTYVPLIGLFIIIAWGIPAFLPQWPRRNHLLGLLSGLLILLCTILSWGQVRYWHDSFTLFHHALRVTTDNYVAHNCLGIALSNQGNIDEGITHFQTALRIKPNYPSALNNLGLSYEKQPGQITEAIEVLRRALEINPHDVTILNNLGILYGKAAQTALAIDVLQQALHIKPDYADAWNNLGNAYGQFGQPAEAIDAFLQALRIDPSHAQACNNLGAAYAESGQFAKAAEYFRQCLLIEPGQASVLRNLGTSLRKSGRPAEAIDAYQQVLSINPDDARAWFGLCAACGQSGRREQAIKAYDKLNVIDPAAADACQQLLNETGVKMTD